MRTGISMVAVILPCALALGIAGCGDSAATPLEEAEAEYRELDAQSKQLDKEAGAASDRALKASDEVLAMLEEQREAVLEGDLATYQQNRRSVKAAEQKSNGISRQAEALWTRAEPIDEELSAIAGRIEALKGCDQTCRHARQRAVNLSTQCMTRLIQRMPAEQAVETCDRRYPVPREDILKDVLDEG